MSKLSDIENNSPTGEANTGGPGAEGVGPSPAEPPANVSLDYGVVGGGAGTETSGGPGTGGGTGAEGDQTGPGDRDTLKEMNGDVPLPAGMDKHAPIPGRSENPT